MPPRTAEGVIPGDPKGNAAIGPVVSRAQWDKIQGLIEKGVEEGATLVAGGPGKPEGLEPGHYVKPTVFADVTNDMTIAREEIFGPVLCILGYEDYDDAIRIANDTEYGLASAITGEDIELARSLANGQHRQLRLFIVYDDLVCPSQCRLVKQQLANATSHADRTLS